MTNDLQNKIFEKILKRYTKKSEAVEVLSQALQVGKDAVYRRMRGDSILTPYEIDLLTRKYQISLDSLIFEKSDTVFFSYNAFTQRVTNFREYLEGIKRNIEQAHTLPEVDLYYASMEIPVFHYFYNHQLTAFKLYVWGLTSLGFDFLEGRKFNFNFVSPDNFQTTDYIAKLYNTMPTTELYSLNIVDHTLNHIEYIATIDGYEDPEDALVLCDAVQDIMMHTRNMAEAGMKFSPGAKPQEGVNAKFDLYHNELVSTNNTFLLKSKVGRVLYTTFGNPNFLSTTDEKMCNYTEKWLQTTINKSTSISTHSEKNRAWFFNRLEKKIKSTRRRIEVLLDD